MWSPLPCEVLDLLGSPIRPIGEKTWESVNAQIDAYRSLTDDYDGQGAKAPAPAVFDGTEELVRRMIQHGIPAPSYVVTGVNGSVNLEWDYPERVTAAIEVTEPDEADVFLLIPGQEPGYWVLTQTAAV